MKIKTFPSAYGAAKVHFGERRGGDYVLGCTRRNAHAHVVPDDTPITCKKCDPNAAEPERRPRAKAGQQNVPRVRRR